jgi:hypothetical protein
VTELVVAYPGFFALVVIGFGSALLTIGWWGVRKMIEKLEEQNVAFIHFKNDDFDTFKSSVNDQLSDMRLTFKDEVHKLRNRVGYHETRLSVLEMMQGLPRKKDEGETGPN